jgi:Flp pilus assembly protein TadD
MFNAAYSYRNTFSNNSGQGQFFREAARIQPESGRVQLGLGLAMMSSGDPAGATPHLQQAATDSDPAIRDEAAAALRKIGK